MVTFPLSVAQLITLVICVDREQGSEYGRQGQHAHPTHPTPPSSSPFYPGTQLPQHAHPTPPSFSPFYPGTQLPQHILTLLTLLLLGHNPSTQVHSYHSMFTLLTLLLLAPHPSTQVHSPFLLFQKNYGISLFSLRAYAYCIVIMWSISTLCTNFWLNNNLFMYRQFVIQYTV